MMQRIPNASVFQIIREAAIGTVPQVIEGADVVYEPKYFVSMRNQMCLGPKANIAVRCIQIYPTECHHLLKQEIRGINFGEINFLYLMPLFFEHGL